jgi:carbon-monoxide dehydrogenase large subunit
MPDDVTADRTEPTSYIGQRRKRFEDVPLLVGACEYTSDLRFDDMVELAIVRSPSPHARIVRVRRP